MLFPKVTYSKKEFLEFLIDVELHENDTTGFPPNTEAMASNQGIIWLPYPSVKLLLHELLHIIFWKCKVPLICHRIIEIAL